MAADRCRSPVGLSSRPSTWSGSPYRASTPGHHQCRFGRGILPVLCRGGGCAVARVDRGYLAVERGRGRVQHGEQHGPRAWGTSLASASDVARARPSTAALGQPLSFLRPWLSSSLPWLPVCTTRAEWAACNNGRRGDGHCGLAGPGVLLLRRATARRSARATAWADVRDSVLFQQAAELAGILGQVSRVDRSAGVRQADPGGNNGTVSGLSSENSFTATPWAAKYSIACAGRSLAMPQAVGRMAAPYRRPRCARRIPGLSPGAEPTRRWLALPGCPVKSQGVLCIGRAQEKARYRPGGQINRFV